MKAQSFAVTALVLTVASTGAVAHHSRANFDLDRVVEIDGVVKEFTWRNPHVFAVIESTDANGVAVDWTFELNATPVLQRYGWSPDSLVVGEHVIATGNPDRDSSRRFIYGNEFVKDDGTEIWSWGGDPVAAPVPVVKGSQDFSGVWSFHRDAGFDVLGRNAPDSRGADTTLPVNAKGRAQIAAFDPDSNPNWDCLPETLPTILGHPYPFEIVHENDERLLIRYEVGDLERLVHLDGGPVPSDWVPTPLGYSVGHIDGRVLVIETAGYDNVRWGNGRGVDSGRQKTTVERYTLSDDGKTLSLVFTMEDPEFLNAPVTVEHSYDLTAGYELQDYICDPETSRRHLTAGKEQ